MKELLECPTEVTPVCADIDVGFDAVIFPPLLIGVYFQWDQSSTDVFQVLNECDSAQVRIEVMSFYFSILITYTYSPPPPPPHKFESISRC